MNHKRSLTRIALAVAAASAMVATGCNRSSGEPANHPLGSLLIDKGPKGYTLTPDASGPQDLSEAATSVGIVGTSAVRKQLGRTGFQSAYARLWEDGDDYAVAVVFDFLSATRAKEFVEFVADDVAKKEYAAGYSLEGIPDGRGFTVNAVKSKGLENVFCQLAIFSHGTKAFDLYTCGAQPNSSSLATDLAREQFKKAS